MRAESSFRPPWAVVLLQLAASVTLAVLLLVLTLPIRAQEYGYSYMRIAVEGKSVTNFVHNSRYTGWLQVEAVRAGPALPVTHSAPETASGGAGAAGTPTKVEKVRSERWTTLPSLLRSRRGGAGELRFGAGDDGGLQPLFDAQKQRTNVPQAELELYDEDKNVLIGRYKLTGIRILSLENVPASACAMSEVTLSFRAIEKE